MRGGSATALWAPRGLGLGLALGCPLFHTEGDEGLLLASLGADQPWHRCGAAASGGPEPKGCGQVPRTAALGPGSPRWSGMGARLYSGA